MINLKAQYPNILKAALIIFYDNGMINREEPEAEVVASLEKDLDISYINVQLQQMEVELSYFSSQELDALCTGSEEEQERLTFSDDLDTLLNFIFER